MHAGTMQLYAKDMLKNANIECNTVTVLHCRKNAINMLKYADNMHLHARNMQKYANNMQTLCIKYDGWTNRD